MVLEFQPDIWRRYVLADMEPRARTEAVGRDRFKDAMDWEWAVLFVPVYLDRGLVMAFVFQVFRMGVRSGITMGVHLLYQTPRTFHLTNNRAMDEALRIAFPISVMILCGLAIIYSIKKANNEVQ